MLVDPERWGVLANISEQSVEIAVMTKMMAGTDVLNFGSADDTDPMCGGPSAVLHAIPLTLSMSGRW